jgi:hypothetical protein
MTTLKISLSEPWDIKTKAAAAKYISDKIEEMQTLFQNIISVADTHDVRVSEMLDWPEDIGRTGHNESMRAEVYWNPSSKYC